MAENKRYYWLQLKKDFFKTRAMKKLRSIAGGDTYTIIYLKMQLLSLENSGYLFHEGVESDMLDEIALDIDESYDNVKMTFEFLLRCNLIESKDDEMFLPEVTESIGSETASAQRVRRFRASRDKKALQCNSGVTSCNVELKKELKKEIEIKKKGDTPKRKRFTPDLSFIENDDWKKLYQEWVDNKKSPFKKQIGVEKGFTELFNISGYNLETAQKIVDKSLANNWSGLFELKENKPEKIDNHKRGKRNFEI